MLNSTGESDMWCCWYIRISSKGFIGREWGGREIRSGGWEAGWTLVGYRSVADRTAFLKPLLRERLQRTSDCLDVAS